jgi:prepilin-type N-terminal cleavage/methylation domain-containing protein
MKKTKGFTLVELVIVIVIVGILSIVAVPIYRGYTRKAMASEGKSLLGSIQTSEKIYYAEYGNFYTITGSTAYNPLLDVDARANKYFTAYSVTSTTPSDEFGATTVGMGGASGITLSLSARSAGQVTTLETI